MKYGVYCITNKANGKRLFSTNIAYLKDHLRNYESVKLGAADLRTSNRKLCDDIIFYGEEFFEIETFFDGLDKETAKEKETELIAFYKANDQQFGYNWDGTRSKRDRANMRNARIA